jgi:hypothetical protein
MECNFTNRFWGLHNGFGIDAMTNETMNDIPFIKKQGVRRILAVSRALNFAEDTFK